MRTSKSLFELVESVTDKIEPIVEEDLEGVSKSIAEFRKAKEVMERPGFTNYDDYLD